MAPPPRFLSGPELGQPGSPGSLEVTGFAARPVTTDLLLAPAPGAAGTRKLLSGLFLHLPSLLRNTQAGADKMAQQVKAPAAKA